MARFIPPHPKKGSPEAYAWAERMRKAKAVKRKNPGERWHDREADHAHDYVIESDDPDEKLFYAGVESAHKISASAARRMGMNPGPSINVLLKKYDLPVSKALPQGLKVRLIGNKWAVLGLPSKKYPNLFPIRYYNSSYPALKNAEQYGWNGAEVIEGMNPDRPHGLFRRCVKDVTQSLKKYHRKGDPKAICGAVLSRAYARNPITIVGNPLQCYVVVRRKDKAGLIVGGHDLPRYRTNGYWVHGPFVSRKQALSWFNSKKSLNPPADQCPKVAGIIYNKALDIHATKTRWKKGDYEHPFGRGVRVEALDNGDVLLHSINGKPLWKHA